jgi:phasin family protein
VNRHQQRGPTGRRDKGSVMIKNFDEIQLLGKENFDVAMKSFNAASKGAQAIAVEMADYSKKAMEDSTQALEKLLGAKSIEKAIELQQNYLKDAYEGFVSKATKVGELYADIAKETYKPYEGFFAKATSK